MAKQRKVRGYFHELCYAAILSKITSRRNKTKTLAHHQNAKANRVVVTLHDYLYECGFPALTVKRIQAVSGLTQTFFNIAKTPESF